MQNIWSAHNICIKTLAIIHSSVWIVIHRRKFLNIVSYQVTYNTKSSLKSDLYQPYMKHANLKCYRLYSYEFTIYSTIIKLRRKKTYHSCRTGCQGDVTFLFVFPVSAWTIGNGVCDGIIMILNLHNSFIFIY